MQIYTRADLDPGFLQEIQEWMVENGVRGNVILGAHPFLAVLLGASVDPVKFVCFHRPYDIDAKEPFGMRRYYDPNYLDHRVKKQVLEIYEAWQAQSVMLSNEMSP